MITIKNIDKILAINSQDIEIMTFQEYNTLYEFEFEHRDIHSTIFKVHMNRVPCTSDNKSYLMKLWDGIASSQLEYNFGIHDVKDPFALLKYLNDVIYDWNVLTNK